MMFANAISPAFSAFQLYLLKISHAKAILLAILTYGGLVIRIGKVKLNTKAPNPM